MIFIFLNFFFFDVLKEVWGEEKVGDFLLYIGVFLCVYVINDLIVWFLDNKFGFIYGIDIDSLVIFSYLVEIF